MPGTPRVASLDALLRDIDGLRLSLATDLSLAAAAVEAGATGIAADILDGDRAELRGFETRALGHLEDLSDADLDAPNLDTPAPADEVAPTRRRRLLPAATFVAAASVIGFLAATVPGPAPTGDKGGASTTVASSSLLELSKLATRSDTTLLRDKAVSLHAQLAPIVTQAATQPALAQQALVLLAQERSILSRSAGSTGLTDILEQSRLLTAHLTAALPAAVRPAEPSSKAVVPAAVPTLVSPPSRTAPTTTSPATVKPPSLPAVPVLPDNPVGP